MEAKKKAKTLSLVQLQYYSVWLKNHMVQVLHMRTILSIGQFFKDA